MTDHLSQVTYSSQMTYSLSQVTADIAATVDAEVARRHEANRRAQALLFEWIDDVDQNNLTQEGDLYVLTTHGRIYRIRHFGTDLICVRREDEDALTLTLLMTLCLHPGQEYPVHDSMLARKLMLETDEQEFLRLANVDKNYIEMDSVEHEYIVARWRERYVAEHGVLPEWNGKDREEMVELEIIVEEE